MSSFTRTQWLIAVVGLVGLRCAIGFHFYMEGTSKLRSGTFTSEYFLRAAQGPLAPLYHQLLEDESGEMRLCLDVQRDEATGEVVSFDVNPELTIELWRDFADRIRPHYRLGDVALLDELAERREALADQIRSARAARDTNVDTRALERQRAADEAAILAIRSQNEQVDEILEAHIGQLEGWLASQRVAILEFFGTRERLEGFDRDGDSRAAVATYVSSLRDQVATIRKDREQKLRGWAAEVEALYDSLEFQLNDLAVDRQAEQPYLSLHRPFDQPNSRLKVLDRVVPWFDTTIGVLLLLGLFTRVASVAAALFLLSVIASQPPWLPGTTETYFQSVEFCGLVLLAATGAGRFAGLDYFFQPGRRPRIGRRSAPQEVSA